MNTGRFANAWNTVTPIAPQTLGAGRTRRLPRKWTRRLVVVGTGGALVYTYDRYLNARAFARTVKTLYTGTLAAVDYKMNFTIGKADKIKKLHDRNADRIYDLLVGNGGLYIKIGQALAMQSAVLPAPYQQKFSTLFDSAPAVSYREIEKVFVKELGVPPDEYFETFDHRAAASASVAQVHKAKLKKGPVVAVKVQKPEIRQQLEWDLWSFKVLMWTYEKLFDLPAMFAVDFISKHLRQECDFALEADNAIMCSNFIKQEPELRNRVYVPKVYKNCSSKRVMVAEWIDGVRLSDLSSIESMGISKKTIMQIMVDLFSAQVMKGGFLHCDPHPGNLFFRYVKNKPQLVLIDHGLYITMTEEFRQKYCLLWKSLMTFDNATIKNITEGWGIHSPDLFASATLMRPYEGGDDSDLREALSHEESYKAQLLIKQKLKEFLKDSEKLPLELVFIGRNMRIVQGHNQRFGSPVNRVKITATWASSSLISTPQMTIAQRLRAWLSHLTFLGTCFMLDVSFYTTRLGQILFRRKAGFEDLLERSLEKQMNEIGFDVNHDIFQG